MDKLHADAALIKKLTINKIMTKLGFKITTNNYMRVWHWRKRGIPAKFRLKHQSFFDIKKIQP